MSKPPDASSKGKKGNTASHASAATEVSDRPVRRRFAAEYKLRILREADACGPGGIGALLRREGPYSSHLATWRRQRAGTGLAPQKRGRRADPRAAEVAALQRRLGRAEDELRRARLIIDVQKKLCAALGLEPRRGEE